MSLGTLCYDLWSHSTSRCAWVAECVCIRVDGDGKVDGVNIVQGGGVRVCVEGWGGGGGRVRAFAAIERFVEHIPLP